MLAALLLDICVSNEHADWIVATIGSLVPSGIIIEIDCAEALNLIHGGSEERT